MRDETAPDPITAPTDLEVNTALGITTGPVRGDVATVIYATASTGFIYDGSMWGDPAQLIDGDLVVDGTLAARKFIADEIFTNTLRSNNYVAPTLAENPPNSGYSLEHVEGIGFFEEIRANVTGTITAPSQTPSSGSYIYNTSFVTREYLNISIGDPVSNYLFTEADGTQVPFREILSNPVLSLTLPTSPRVELVTSSFSDWAGLIEARAGANYDWYYRLTSNLTSGEGNLGSWNVGPIWIGYDSDGNRINDLDIATSDGISRFFTTSRSSAAATGVLNSSTSTTTTDSVLTFSTGGDNGVEVTSEIPAEMRLHFSVLSAVGADQVFNYPETAPFDLQVGIRANSSVSFRTFSNDGSAQTTSITQGDA